MFIIYEDDGLGRYDGQDTYISIEITPENFKRLTEITTKIKECKEAVPEITKVSLNLQRLQIRYWETEYGKKTRAIFHKAEALCYENDENFTFHGAVIGTEDIFKEIKDRFDDIFEHEQCKITNSSEGLKLEFKTHEGGGNIIYWNNLKEYFDKE